jgi:voltage-gated potassium channel
MSLKMSKYRLFEILEVGKGSDITSKICDNFLVLLVIGSIFSVILGSVPEIDAEFSEELRWFEIITVLIFTVEYLLRLWVAPLKYKQSQRPKIKYISSFYGIVDLAAILPFYVSLFGFGVDLRVLRAARLLRILKISHYNTALQDLALAIYDERKSFVSAIYIFTVTLLITSSLIFFAENSKQPEDFRSIPDAIWWSLITLTTVGYGDVSPITPVGKIIGAITALLGVCTVALLTGIVGNAFSAQLSRKRSEFRSEVIKALQDGVITDSEHEYLDKLRDEFNMSKQHARSILIETLQDMGLHTDKNYK